MISSLGSDSRDSNALKVEVRRELERSGGRGGEGSGEFVYSIKREWNSKRHGGD